MSKIRLVAGDKAFSLIKENGFKPSMVRAVAAAAGGPKWFTTYGLVRYIIADLLPPYSQNIDFIGSSVGSWQMAAACTIDPGAAIDRLQHAYSHHIYSDDPDAQEITDACGQIISAMIDDRSKEILDAKTGRLHVITSRGKGLLTSNNKFMLGAAFGVAALSHSIKRSFLNNYVQRVLFSNSSKLPFDVTKDTLFTNRSLLTNDNLHDALQASGAIPLLMKPKKSIGDFSGTFWDGGITDYHISLPYQFDDDGIVLHPHFSPYVLEGWFDKKLPYIRHARASNMSKVLLIFPSESFIESLPFKKITDLKDFYDFDKDQNARMEYWNEVSQRSKELGEELNEIISAGDMASRIVKYSDHIKGL